MKKFLIALALVISAASILIAKSTDFTGCTNDGVKVSSTFSLDDEVPAITESRLKVAFSDAASKLSFKQFITAEGFYTFLDTLSEEDFEFVNQITTPKNIGSCK